MVLDRVARQAYLGRVEQHSVEPRVGRVAVEVVTDAGRAGRIFIVHEQELSVVRAAGRAGSPLAWRWTIDLCFSLRLP